MRAEKLPIIVLAILIFLLAVAADPAAALAQAAKSSLPHQGSGGMGRKFPGAPVSRSRPLSANQAPGPLRRIPASIAALPRIPAGKLIPYRSKHDLLAPKSLRGSLACLPRSSSPAHKVPPRATPPAARVAPNSSSCTDRIVAQARNYLGTPYQLGGSLETGKSTDCSGFVQYIYQKSDIDLPRSSSEQAQAGAVVTRTLDFARLLPGDLLFFGRGGSHIGHVGIYLGDGKMIHAASRRGVIISDLRHPSREGSFVVAKRIPEVQSAKSKPPSKE